MLSFPRAGWTLAVDIALDGDTTHYNQLLSILHGLDELVAANGGSVYLAKNAALQPDILERMYPRLSEFQAVRRRLDPNGVFQSDMSRRCGLSGVL
jgi:decaprenylphospho-beta-D-ribofuranose 2-oxidase